MILPLPLFWIGIILFGVLYLRGKKSTALKVAFISLIWLLLISTPFLPNFLTKNLEKQYNTVSKDIIDNQREPVNILVLGGGFTNDNRLPPNDKLSEAALCRLIEGIRLHRLLPESTLITSGYGMNEDISQAEVMAQTALLLGVDSSNLKSQIIPSNTYEESQEYLRLFGNDRPLILVTSAIHMPRSMYLFNKANLNPIAAPTNHLVKKRNHKSSRYYLPSSGNIGKIEAAVHEYMGLLWYKLGGS